MRWWRLYALEPVRSLTYGGDDFRFAGVEAFGAAWPARDVIGPDPVAFRMDFETSFGRMRAERPYKRTGGWIYVVYISENGEKSCVHAPKMLTAMFIGNI
jgi:hypothetical protein